MFKLGLNLKPFDEKDLNLNVNYTASRIHQSDRLLPDRDRRRSRRPSRIASCAMPNGQLLRIDSRPVNFARSDREELRWGINFSKPIGPQPPPGGFRGRGGGRRRCRRSRAGPRLAARPLPADPRRARRRPGRARRRSAGAAGRRSRRRRWQGGGGRGGGGFGGRGGGGFGGGRGGRIQFALYHNWRLEDRILIRDGVPELDLLDGSAVGSRGGQPRHELEFQAGTLQERPRRPADRQLAERTRRSTAAPT